MDDYKKILQDVKNIFEENGIEIVDINAKTDVDSLTIVSIIVSLEEHFDVSFPDSIFATDDILYVNRLTNLIINLQNNKEAI